MTIFNADEARGQIDAAEAEIDRLTAVVRENAQTMEQLRIEIQRLSGHNWELMAKIANLEAENTRLKARIAELTPLKPALRGLVTTNPDYRVINLPYAEFVSIKPHWKTHNPSLDVYNFDMLDATLAKHPGIMFRFRFMAGIHAPDWVKSRSGGAIQHNPDTATGGSGLVPRFWTENYFQDYMAFMDAVARHYENHPQVVEIPNSLTTTVYAEPFILNADAATITRYWEAGYQFDQVKNNLIRSIHGMMDLFPTTRISLAGHGKWERIIDGKINRDWPALRAVFNEMIAAYGPRLIVDDHGLGADDALGVPEPPDGATTWYNYMAGLQNTETTYGWQFTPKGFSLDQAADMGVTMGARFEEFAHFNFEGGAAKRLQIHNALLANASGKP